MKYFQRFGFAIDSRYGGLLKPLRTDTEAQELQEGQQISIFF